jgi:hypothetical protein
MMKKMILFQCCLEETTGILVMEQKFFESKVWEFVERVRSVK